MEQSEVGNSVDRQSEIVDEAMPLVSCIWCEKLHRAEHPLEFNPVCSTFAGRYPMESLEMSGSYPLSDKAVDDAVPRVSSGNCALEYMDGDTFIVFCVCVVRTPT